PAPAGGLPGHGTALGPAIHAGVLLVGGIHMKRRTSPGPSMLLTQRPQSSGCFGFDPTSGRRCQQRTHFGSVVGFTAIQTPLRPVLVAGTASAGGAPSIRCTRA